MGECNGKLNWDCYGPPASCDECKNYLDKLTNEEVIQYLKNSLLDKFSIGSGFQISTSDGWFFSAYDDCGEIDYIEYVIAPDGREIQYDDISEELQAVFASMFGSY